MKTLPNIEIEEPSEGCPEWVASLEGTGIVVSGTSRENVIDELMISIRVQLLYQLKIKER